MEHQSRITLLGVYVFVTVTLTALVCVMQPFGLTFERPQTTLLLVALGTFAGLTPVPVPRKHFEATVTEPFILSALALVGPLGAMLVAASAVACSSVVRTRRHGGLRFVQNLAVVLFSTAMAAVAFRELGGLWGQKIETLIVPLLGASAVYFGVNTLMVAAAVALEQDRPLGSTWRTTLPSFASYAAGMAVTLAFLYLHDANLLAASVVGLASCKALTTIHRTSMTLTDSP